MGHRRAGAPRCASVQPGARSSGASECCGRRARCFAGWGCWHLCIRHICKPVAIVGVGLTERRWWWACGLGSAVPVGGVVALWCGVLSVGRLGVAGLALRPLEGPARGTVHGAVRCREHGVILLRHAWRWRGRRSSRKQGMGESFQYFRWNQQHSRRYHGC